MLKVGNLPVFSSQRLTAFLGYWIPYEAARAIAAKFCWEIRYVLTPVFGADFPDCCLLPDDPCFLKLNVDKSIVHHCTDLANRFRGDVVEPLTRSTHRQAQDGAVKSLRPKPTVRPDYESGYGTDTDRSQPNSPESVTQGWTAINGPQMPAPPRLKRSPISTIPRQSTQLHNQQNNLDESHYRCKRQHPIEDGNADDRDLTTQNVGDDNSIKRLKYATKAADARAAYTLVALHQADVTFAERAKSLGRRASWPA